MPKAQKPLTDEIIRGVLAMKKGPNGWFTKLPPDVQAELTAIREQFVAGQIAGTRTALARSIHAALKARDMISVTHAEVMRWLEAA
jgi:hypothetical protein